MSKFLRLTTKSDEEEYGLINFDHVVVVENCSDGEGSRLIMSKRRISALQVKESMEDIVKLLGE